MFYRNAAFLERQMEWVFGECKTFNKFKQRDIDRMQVISDNSPNSVLVFANFITRLFRRRKDVASALRQSVSILRKAGPAPSCGPAAYRHRVVLDLWPALMLEAQDWQREAMGRCSAGLSLTARALRRDTIHLSRLNSWSADWQIEFQRRREEANAKPDGS